MSTQFTLVVEEPIPVGTYTVTLNPVAPSIPGPPKEGSVFIDGKLVWTNASWSSLLAIGDAVTVQITGKWGGFQVSAPGGAFDTSKFKALTYRVKATRAQTFGTSFHAPNGNETSVVLQSAACPPNVWTTVTIPLVNFKLTDPVIRMFSIGDSSGQASNSYQLDSIRFI